MKIQEIDVNTYQNFLDLNHLGYKMLQSPAFAKLHGRIILAGVSGENKISHVIIIEPKQAMKLWKYAYSAGGYISKDESKDVDFVNSICDYLRKNKYIVWQMESSKDLMEYDKKGKPVHGGYHNANYLIQMKRLGFEWTDLGQGYNPNHQMTWQSVIDLTDKPTFDDVFKTFTGNKRRDVKNAVKKGLTMEIYKPSEMTEDLWNVVETLMHQSAEYQGYHEPTMTDNQQFINAFGDEFACVGIVYTADHEPAYAGVWVWTSTQMMYLYSGMDRKFMKYSPVALAQATMIDKAIKLGMKEYNFGGISGYFNEGEEGYGVYKMKECMGGVVHRTIGPLTISLNTTGDIFKKRMV